MSYQVNLLDEGEVRDTSRVSQKFIAIMGGGALVALMFFTVLFISWRLNSVEAKLSDTQDYIEDMKPAYDRVMKTDAELKRRTAAFDELEGWKNTSIDLVDCIQAVGREVPDSIQLIDLKLSGKLKSSSASSKATATRLRGYSLKISGKSEGERADSSVLDFIRTLQEVESLKTYLESAKLDSMRNTGANNESGSIRAFSITCAMEDKPWL